MPYVISHDLGAGNPPAFLHKMDNGTPVWGLLDDAQSFKDESLAQSVIEANNLFDTIVMPLDVDVFNGE